MNFLFVMDPLETVNFTKDTSFIFMRGAYKKGHNIYYVPNNGISSNKGSICFNALHVTPQEKSFDIHEWTTLTDDDVQTVFIRKDPPFDDQYLMNTWLLDRLPKNVFVINNPTGVRAVNEKVWATQFTNLIPKTLVSADRDELISFLSEIGKGVAKPTDGFGGQSVFKVSEGDSNSIVAMETLTNAWNKPIIVQEYIKDAEIGDKRILLLNGEPLGAVLRVHGTDDHRNNFFAGGHPEAAEITDRDKEIIATLKPHLLKLGLYFVGIDVMGDYLIEVNVTSPTCLQEMNRLYNKSLEDDVISFVESKISA